MSAALPAIPALPPPPGQVERPPVSQDDILAAAWVRDNLLQISLTTGRSLQAHLGPSEIGQACERRLAYRIAHLPYVNIADPLKAMLGTGFHTVAAEGFARLNAGSDRYLIETRCSYRGVAGSVDLYDRYQRRVIDWKTSDPKRIQRYRREGSPLQARVQIAIYAQALIAAGLQVESTALVYIPRGGELADITAFVAEPDKRLADDYIDRYLSLHERVEAGMSPAEVDATPGPLCEYCPNYNPVASNLDSACPGRK